MSSQIEDLHLELDEMVEDEQLYFSEQHKKFIVKIEGRDFIFYHELSPDLCGLVYQTCWSTETQEVDIVCYKSLHSNINAPVTLYSTEIVKIEKLFFYGEFHTATLEAAVHFASLHHGEQVRKSNYEPYVFHLFEVLNLIKCLERDVNEATLIASVLHDIVEDTHVTKESIEFLFGGDVANIVEELTCEDANNSEQKKHILLEQLKTASVPAKIIKLADLISNINSIPTKWTSEKKESYLNWCDEVAVICKGTSENLYHVYMQKRAIFSSRIRFQ